MVAKSDPPNIIPASVPDIDVPSEKVETASGRGLGKRRADRFLKGPIPFAWIREHVQCPTDRLLLVLKAHTDMQRVNEIRLTADILRDAGIADRKVAYRATHKLEANGSLAADHRQGRRAIVRLAPVSKTSRPELT